MFSSLGHLLLLLLLAYPVITDSNQCACAISPAELIYAEQDFVSRVLVEDVQEVSEPGREPEMVYTVKHLDVYKSLLPTGDLPTRVVGPIRSPSIADPDMMMVPCVRVCMAVREFQCGEPLAKGQERIISGFIIRRSERSDGRIVENREHHYSHFPSSVDFAKTLFKKSKAENPLHLQMDPCINRDLNQTILEILRMEAQLHPRKLLQMHYDNVKTRIYPKEPI